ncbi:MAG: putative lipid II flippase FtsW [Kiritimatiellae bacterium]|nr:putative lipid II flippase FtsW [Kiritimatiellia bacterium]
MRKVLSTLITIVAALLALGIVMLASSSSVKGSADLHDPLFFLKRQLIWLFMSCVLGAMVVRFDYHWWQRLAVPLSLSAIVLLILVFVPPLGHKVGGSWRWLRVGPFTAQPSEFAKFVVVLALPAWMTHVGRRVERFVEGLLLPMCGLGLVLLLLIIEPDFGTTLLTGAVGMLILFAGGARIGYLVVTGVVGICGFALAVMQNPVRLGRVLAFLMPEKYPATAYHLTQSKVAFIVGRLHGVGLGDSMQKQLYLPEPHTDFILAIIGEELGFLATFGVLLLFLGLFVCGLIITTKARDPYGRLIAFGMTMMISLQAAINVGVVTGCLPTKGLPLPFISYGGSSLMMSVACVSVLVNVALHSTEGHDDPHTKLIKDRHHRV